MSSSVLLCFRKPSLQSSSISGSIRPQLDSEKRENEFIYAQSPLNLLPDPSRHHELTGTRVRRDLVTPPASLWNRNPQAQLPSEPGEVESRVSQAVQECSAQASLSLESALKSMSSAIASANLASSDAQQSAEQAISLANVSASRAISSAMATQTTLQTEATVGSATESIASGGTSPSMLPTSTSNQIQTNCPSAQATNVIRMTGPQLALAIIGTIIFSSLVTFLLFFFFRRHRRQMKNHARDFQQNSPEAQLRAAGTRNIGSEIDKGGKILLRDEQGMQLVKKPTLVDVSLNRRGEESRSLKKTVVQWDPSKGPTVLPIKPFSELLPTIPAALDTTGVLMTDETEKCLTPGEQATPIPLSKCYEEDLEDAAESPVAFLSPSPHVTEESKQIPAPQASFHSLPTTEQPVRNTAEWLVARDENLGECLAPDVDSSQICTVTDKPLMCRTGLLMTIFLVLSLP